MGFELQMEEDVMDSSGALLSENRYMPFGEVRNISGTTNISETDFGYTGQRDYSGDFGLMDYNARFYSPTLGRFIQADEIVRDAYNPQSWNRYSYVGNNPIKFIDPSGNRKHISQKDLVEQMEMDCENFWELIEKMGWDIETAAAIQKLLNSACYGDLIIGRE